MSRVSTDEVKVASQWGWLPFVVALFLSRVLGSILGALMPRPLANGVAFFACMIAALLISERRSPGGQRTGVWESVVVVAVIAGIVGVFDWLLPPR